MVTIYRKNQIDFEIMDLGEHLYLDYRGLKKLSRLLQDEMHGFQYREFGLS